MGKHLTNKYFADTHYFLNELCVAITEERYILEGVNIPMPKRNGNAMFSSLNRRGP